MTNDNTPKAPRPEDESKTPAAPHSRDDDVSKPASEEEELDEAIEETFPASDPISPSRIDGPNN